VSAAVRRAVPARASPPPITNPARRERPAEDVQRTRTAGRRAERAAPRRADLPMMQEIRPRYRMMQNGILSFCITLPERLQAR